MNATRIAGGLAAGMVVVVVIAGLPGAEVPALPPPVTLRSEVMIPERDRNSLVITPEPVFERAQSDQTDTPLEVASPDEDTGGTQAVSVDSPDDSETEQTEATSVESPDESPAPEDSPDPAESADSPDADSPDADSADSPDGADSPDD